MQCVATYCYADEQHPLWVFCFVLAPKLVNCENTPLILLWSVVLWIHFAKFLCVPKHCSHHFLVWWHLSEFLVLLSEWLWIHCLVCVLVSTFMNFTHVSLSVKILLRYLFSSLLYCSRKFKVMGFFWVLRLSVSVPLCTELMET